MFPALVAAAQARPAQAGPAQADALRGAGPRGPSGAIRRRGRLRGPWARPLSAPTVHSRRQLGTGDFGSL